VASALPQRRGPCGPPPVGYFNGFNSHGSRLLVYIARQSLVMLLICDLSGISIKLVLIQSMEEMRTLTIVKQKPCINQLILWFSGRTLRILSFQRKIIAIIIIHSDPSLFHIFARIPKHMTIWISRFLIVWVLVSRP
jgi:hypothetical protein